MPSYDVIDDGVLDTAAFVGPTAMSAGAFSYCKSGDEHFAAMLVSGNLEVWHYSGGVRSAYLIGTVATVLGGILTAADYGPAPIKLRTDGTNVWLVYVEIEAFQRQTPTHGIINYHSSVPVVAVWNGAGFSVIGTDASRVDNRGFHSQDFARDQGRIGSLTAAASSAEPGALHIAWTEGGAYIDGDPPWNIIQRLAYSKWSNAGPVSSSELASSQTLAGSGYDGNFPNPVITQHLFLTNGRGSPLVFYGVPATNNTLATGAPAATITYSENVQMIDVNAGGTVLRTITGSSIDATITALDSAHVDYTIGGSRVPTSPFGTELVYLSVPWYNAGGADPLLISGPADGSAAFSYPDGSSTENPSSLGPDIDVVDETRNIWAGINGFSLQLRQFHRNCPGWAYWGSALSACDGFSPVEFELDGNTIYTIGRDATDHTKFGVIAVPILRNAATCGGGLHIWDRW